MRKKNVKENKRMNFKKAVLKLTLATMSVTAMANAGAFPSVFENPAYVLEAAESTDKMQPQNVTVTDVDPFTVTVSWDEVEGASKYYILYGEPGKATTTVSTKKTSITIKKFKADKTYVFSVKSRYKNENNKVADSTLSKAVYHDTMAIPALDISATNTSTENVKSITLSFSTHYYMTRTYVYRSTDGTNYENVKTLSASQTSYVDKNVEEGQTYYYKVRTYSNDKKHICYGPYSNVVSVTIEKPVVEAPTTEAPTTEAPTTEAPTTEAPTTEAPAKTPEEIQAERDAENKQMAYDILNMVNAERAKLGYAPLTMNEDLLNVSAVRAQEIKTKYSHTRPNGTRWSTAYKEAGITYTGTKGENLMWGVNTAEQFYSAWFNSPGHYRNMTNPNFTQIGITIYQDPTTGYRYAAMELAKEVCK